MSEKKAEKDRSWVNHPLTNLVLGFLLTGVLGTALTQNFMDRREREKLRSQAAIARKEAVKELSQLMAARQLHAELFVEGIESGASSEEIGRLKAGHQEAYETWRLRRASTMLLAREVMSDAHYREFAGFINIRLVENTFVPIRSCISEIFSRSKQRQAALTAIERCKINDLLQRSVQCSDGILEALYVFAAAGTSNSRIADSDAISDATQGVEQACP